MARVRPEVNELVITDQDTHRRVVLRGGDVVPPWALDVFSNPRLIDETAD